MIQTTCESLLLLFGALEHDDVAGVHLWAAAASGVIVKDGVLCCDRTDSELAWHLMGLGICRELPVSAISALFRLFPGFADMKHVRAQFIFAVMNPIISPSGHLYGKRKSRFLDKVPSECVCCLSPDSWLKRKNSLDAYVEATNGLCLKVFCDVLHQLHGGRFDDIAEFVFFQCVKIGSINAVRVWADIMG